MLSNVEKKERKYSWSTVFAWLFLKTIGRILPKRWIKWAEDILYYDKVTADQTDDLKTVDENVQKDGETTFQDMAIRTDDLMKVDASKPEVAEKETSEDEGIYSAAEDCSDIEVGNNELTWDNCCEMHGEDDEKLEGELENVSLELKIERLQNIFLEKENGELRSKNEELERENFEVTTEKEQLKLQLVEYEEDYIELEDVTDQIEKELEEQVKEYLVEMEEKERKIRDLTWINKVLNEDLKLRIAKVERLSAELEKVRSTAMLSIGEHTKTLDENLTLKNQHIENSPSEDEQPNGELKEKDTQEQKKSHKTGAVSLDSKYNEKLVQSHTECLTLEDKVKQYTPMTYINIASINPLSCQRAVTAGF
ncbi:MAG: hypothetical protein ACR5K9_01250 [Wolbachia sp.]